MAPVRFDSLVFAEDGRESHDDGGEGRLDVLVGVGDELLDARQDAGHDHLLLVVSGQVLAELCSEITHITSLAATTHQVLTNTLHPQLTLPSHQHLSCQRTGSGRTLQGNMAATTQQAPDIS